MKCSAENCLDNYIEESATRLIEGVEDQGEGDTKSHVLKHSIENNHVEVTHKDFKIIGSHFVPNTENVYVHFKFNHDHELMVELSLGSGGTMMQ